MQGGFGLQVQIKISAILTAIANVLDGSAIPDFEKVLKEMTPHSATGGQEVYVASGKFKASSFKVTLGWDKSDTTHAAITAAFNSLSPVDMAIITPGAGGETLAGQAHIFKMSRISKQTDGFQCDVEIQPTGVWTVA